MVNLKQLFQPIIVATVLGAISSTDASELSDAAASLNPGEWVLLPTQNFGTSVLLQGGGHHVLQYQESMKWDPVRREVNFVGSGHLQPYVHVIYDEQTNSWSQRATPSYFDTSHGYDHMALDPVSRRFYFRQFNSNRLEIFDLDSRTWTRSASMPQDTWLVAGGLAWFPELQSVLFVDSVRISTYEPSTDSWSTVTNNTAGLGEYHNFAEYSPKKHVAIYGGGNNSSAVYRLDSNRNLTRMSDAPVGLGIHQSMVVADPVSGNFVVFTANSIYEYDPNADTWQKQAVTIPYNVGTDPGVVGASAAPISDYGVIMIVKYDGDDSKVFLYRHAAGSGIPAPKRPMAPVLQSD